MKKHVFFLLFSLCIYIAQSNAEETAQQTPEYWFRVNENQGAVSIDFRGRNVNFSQNNNISEFTDSDTLLNVFWGFTNNLNFRLSLPFAGETSFKNGNKVSGTKEWSAGLLGNYESVFYSAIFSPGYSSAGDNRHNGGSRFQLSAGWDLGQFYESDINFGPELILEFSSAYRLEQEGKEYSQSNLARLLFFVEKRWEALRLGGKLQYLHRGDFEIKETNSTSKVTPEQGQVTLHGYTRYDVHSTFSILGCY
ncbi:MAG: hypothetical protein NZ480_07470 [Bdellovibrionaceae bacterium]|nr:hypothetical protein [Pseudobdellovibrionaceae bacterium]MDW8189905.1 hypothetical protein [Pseudobdellovibrionaceae bacterium]